MPDEWKNAYTEKVLQARRRVTEQLPRELNRQLANEYARQITRILEEVERADNINEQWVNGMLDDLSDGFNRYAARAELQVKDVIEQGVRETVDGHRQGLSAASDIVGIDVDASFGGVPDRAVEAMFVRRDLDITRSYKTLQKFSAQASAEMVEDAIADAVAGGNTYQEATEGVMKGLVQGNEEAEEIIRRLGPRGGTRFGQSVPDIDGARDAARRIGFNARRIAISELGNSFHEGHRLSSVESPVVKAVRWTLSPQHPEPDICDVLADQDIYGLGVGVYPAETVPTKPHPFDLCFLQMVMHEPQNWGTDIDFDEPREISETTIEDVLSQQRGTPTPREVERTTEQFNAINQQAFNLWTTEEV